MKKDYLVMVNSTYANEMVVEAESAEEAEQMALEFEDACLEQTTRWAEHLIAAVTEANEEYVALRNVPRLTKDGDGVMHSSEGITYDGQTVEAEE